MLDVWFEWILIPAALFAVLYFPALNKLARGLASAYPKADVGRRFSAVLLDASLVLSGWFLYRSFHSVAFLLAGLVYVLLRDSFAGRSVGKFCVGLMVVDLETGRPCGRRGSAKRNLLFLVPGANV